MHLIFTSLTYTFETDVKAERIAENSLFQASHSCGCASWAQPCPCRSPAWPGRIGGSSSTCSLSWTPRLDLALRKIKG